MNGDDERDYAEEAVQRDIEVEGEAELAEERAEQSAMEFAVEQADDHAEEVAVQREAGREGLAEQPAGRSAYDPMSGPACYRKACRLVAYAENQIPEDAPAQAAIVARAQVYATLALAAATAEIDLVGRDDGTGRNVDAARAWTAVLR